MLSNFFLSYAFFHSPLDLLLEHLLRLTVVRQ